MGARYQPVETHHVVSFSGGKDSTALVLLAREWAERKGFAPTITFADTGHEHPITYEFVDRLEVEIGLPIQRVRADFTEDMARKRRYIDTKWREEGVADAICDRAIELLQPTGVPMLDLCMMKGRFPSTRARFCTEELKHKPIYEQVLLPLMRTGRVCGWQGVRADESPSRAKMPRLDRGDGRLWNYRPILRWTVEDVFALHRKHGIDPNPLYKMGMGRVGCMPCIMAKKGEIAEIARRFPEEIERVADWERLVAATSKRGLATWFAADKTPSGKALAASAHEGDYPGVEEIADWAKTSRGGSQYDILNFMEDAAPASCKSIYGLCE